MENIRTIYGVPEVVFICWFGDKITENRLTALHSLVANIGVTHVLVTDANVHTLVKQDHPLHDAWPYLSGVHKSDYIRAYLLHHYGGGYHDVKYRSQSWQGQWDAFANDNVWIKGRRERCPGHIGYDVDRPNETRFVQAHYHDLVTMGWVICRPRTPYTRRLLEYIEHKLDLHLSKLRAYPSTCSSGYYAHRPFDKVPSEQCYPIRWLELMGEHFHLLMWEYKEHIEYGLPDADPRGYK